jgi:cation diffusion facilitator CzcD-associated flavoprotein CzcO
MEDVNVAVPTEVDEVTSDMKELDLLIVGAGFGGIYAVHRARQMGLKVRAYEKGTGVGGTWYYNRYPGARCDVDSVDYSYAFSDELQQEWNWSEKFSAQAEILEYTEHVVDRFDLQRDIQLNTAITKLDYDEERRRWDVETNHGETISARWVLLAAGLLTVPKPPPFPGLDSFGGKWYQTSRWPKEPVDFKGKRVAVIGTGSSAIQAIPVIAEDAAQLTVFQRTPNFSIPARNRPLGEEEMAEFKATYAERRRHAWGSGGGLPSAPSFASAMDLSEEEFEAEMERRWEAGGLPFLYAFQDFRTNLESNERIAEFIRGKIAEEVDDPAVAEMLTPRGYPFGAKRPCFDTNYWATFNRDNVELVDVNATPIERITEAGLRTAERDFEFDIIIFAVGFDAYTGAILDIDIHGRESRSLAEHWAEGARIYLGASISGFPNLFVIAGPGRPVNAGLMHHEHSVDWLLGLMDHARRNDIAEVEADAEAEEEWNRRIAEAASKTVYPKVKSWYWGTNIEGKPHKFLVLLEGFDVYQELVREIAREGYTGFDLVPESESAVVV